MVGGGVWRHEHPPFKTPDWTKRELTFNPGWQTESSHCRWLPLGIQPWSISKIQRMQRPQRRYHRRPDFTPLSQITLLLIFPGLSGLWIWGWPLFLLSRVLFIPPVACRPLFHAESQTRGGETQEGENKPQPGEPEDSAAARAGKWLGLQVFGRSLATRNDFRWEAGACLFV